MQHSKPNLNGEEAKAVYEAILSGNLCTGKICTEFEEKFTELFGYKHVVAVNSGTSALTLALMAFGVGAGDEVIVSPYSMVASVNVVLAVGATPVFADIDPVTYCITPETVAAALTHKTKAVIPVDIFGVPADIDGIRAVIPAGVKIVEDSIEALGSTYKGDFVGKSADCGAFGFFPNKQITTGLGGVLFSQDAEIVEKVRALSRHGVLHGDMYKQSFGHNLRMSDINAAMGLVQLQRFDKLEKALLSVRYRLDLKFSQWRKQRTLKGDYSNDFVYVVQVEGIDKPRAIDFMADWGIPVKPYFVPLHKLDHLAQYVRGPLPVAEKVGAETLALPYHYDISDDDIIAISKAFEKCLQDQGL